MYDASNAYYPLTNPPLPSPRFANPQHLRVWVRRLQSTAQALTSHQQLGSTRTRQRTVAASSSDNPDFPYTWVQCSNPSCGKWRALARGIELKEILGENGSTASQWYCVQNWWDEKVRVGQVPRLRCDDFRAALTTKLMQPPSLPPHLLVVAALLLCRTSGAPPRRVVQ